MSKRTIINIHGKDHYAVRDENGRFVDITNIHDSIADDAQQVAKNKAKPDHGHEGDLDRYLNITKRT